jgi:cellulose synthase operon protein C
MKRHIIALTVMSSVLVGCGQGTPEEHVNAGQTLIAKGNTAAAVLEFKNALQLDKDNVGARVGLARIDLDARRFGDAENALDRALSSVGDDPENKAEIHRLLARAYFRNERDRRVLDVPVNGDAEIAFYHVMEWLSSGDSDKARAALADLPADSPFVKMSEAALVAEESPQKALTMLPQDVPKTSAAYAELQLMVAGLSAASSLTGDMLTAMANYYAVEPADDYRSLQYASMLASANKVLDAEPIVDQLLKRYPQHGMLNELKAMAAYERKDYEAALNAARLANVDDPTAISPRLVAAYSATNLGNEQDALNDLEFIIDKLSYSHPAQRLYMHLKAMNGDLTGLKERALSIGDMTPQDAQLLSSIGLEMLRSGNVDDAKALAKKASDLGATGDAASTLGLLKLSLNEDGAFSVLETAFKDGSATEMAGNNLAGAYLGTQRYDEALALADTWAEDGETVKANMLRGVVHARKGHPHHAAEFFETVLRDEPSHGLARASLVESLVALKQDALVRQKIGAWLIDETDLYLLRHYTSAMRNRGELSAAVNFLSEWVDKRFAKSTQAQVMVAQAAFLDNQPDITLARLDALAGTAFEGSREYWLLLSATHERTDDLSALADTYQQWMHSDEANPAPLMGMLRILSGKSDFKGAVALLEKRLPYLEDKAPANLMRTHFLIQQGDWKRARAIFTSLPKAIKATHIAQGIEGALAFERQNYRVAAQKLDAMFATQADETYMQYWMGAYRGLGKADEGYRKLSAHLEKYPASVLGWFALGNHYATSARYAEAENAYREAAKLRDNVLLSNNLAYVLLEQGKLDDAQVIAESAFEKRPDFMSLADTLANILLAQGDAEGASAILAPFVSKKERGEIELSKEFLATLDRVQEVLGK